MGIKHLPPPRKNRAIRAGFKYFFIAIACVFLFGRCSKYSKSDEEEVDPIVGTWKHKGSYYNNNGNKMPSKYFCSAKYMDFTADGKAKAYGYYGGICEASKQPVFFNWKKLKNGNYLLDSEKGAGEQEISFSADHTEMIFKYKSSKSIYTKQ